MKKIIYKILPFLLAFAFGSAGIMKLIGNPTMIEIFTNFGLPIWLMYFIGTAEVAGALGLIFGAKLNPILPRLAASGLGLIILGAIAMHFMNDPLTKAIPAFVLLALLLLYIFGNKVEAVSIANSEPDELESDR